MTRPTETKDRLVQGLTYDTFGDVVEDVLREVRDAQRKWPPFTGKHQGYAIILEELDELWEAVKKNQKDPSVDWQVREEATQVAAMAIRFLYDLC